jgi:hypothetical protein
MMQFDPCLAAQQSLGLAHKNGELGADWPMVEEAEAIFSAEVGEDAAAAYETLQRIGARHPDARAFQEFLIYITWQQVAEETVARHAEKGLELCDRYLSNWHACADDGVDRILQLRASFRTALGVESDDDEDDYDQDTFKGGD